MSSESTGAADGDRSARRRDRGEPGEQHVFRASRRRRDDLHALRYFSLSFEFHMHTTISDIRILRINW